MGGLRGWIIFAWIALPTVMYGTDTPAVAVNVRFWG